MKMYVITALVFAHFLLASALLLRVLHTDYLVLKHYRVPLGRKLARHIEETKKIAFWGLAGLIVTGLLLVAYGAATNPEYMNNPKLWVKFLCVATLTANGFWVHRLSHHITADTIPAELPYALSVQISIAGAVSSASWIFACWLGIARSWNKVVLFEDVLAHYGLVLLAAVCLSMVVNIRFTQPQNHHETLERPADGERAEGVAVRQTEIRHH